MTTSTPRERATWPNGNPLLQTLDEALAREAAEMQPAPILPPGYIWAIDTRTAKRIAVRLDDDGATVPATFAPAAPPAPARVEPETIPQASQGLSLALVQGTCLFCGSILVVAIAAYIILAGVHVAGPYLPAFQGVLIVLSVLVFLLFLLFLAVKTTAGNSGSVSLYHSERTTNVGRQWTWGRGSSINNH